MIWKTILPRPLRVCAGTAVLCLGCDTTENPAPEEAGAPSEEANASAQAPAQGTTDWPATRGGPTLSGRIDAAVPRQPQVEWTLELDSPGQAEAAVADGVLVVGDVMGFIYAIDLETREISWKHESGDTIEAAPAIHEGRVFVGSGDQHFYALDLATGEKVWSIDGGEKFSSAANLIPAPDGVGKRLLLNGYDGITRCLDPADGSELWTYPTDDYINGTPALIDGKYVAFGGCDSILHVVDATTGEMINEVLTDSQITASVATAGTMIYAGNYANQVVAADLNAEEPAWIYDGGQFPFFSSPAVDDERVYIGSRDKSVHAISRETGERAWTFATGGRVESSPIVFDDAVVFGSSDGRLYAVDPASGEEIWRLDLGEKLDAPPVFAAGHLFIAGGGGTLFAIKGD